MNAKIKLLIFLLITMLFVTFSSCEKDLYEQSIKKDKIGKTELLTGKEAVKVALRLKNVLGSQSSLNNSEFVKTITLDFGTINYDEILKIIDSYGKENYTFEIIYPEINDKKIGNLILQEKDNYTTVKLIEYYMTDAFAQDYKLNYDLKQFQGNIKLMPIFTDNPCPEPVLIIQIGNVPANCIGCSGGSNNNNNPIPGGDTIPNGGGTTAPTDPFAVTITDGEGNQDDEHETGEWIFTFKLSIVPVTPTDPTAPIDPCPLNTEIGILPPIDKCTQSFLVDLDDTSKQWLYASVNNNTENVYNELLEYISKSPNCGEASEVGKEIITALKKGGKFNLKNEILLDSTFVANQKVNCVFNKLISQNNSFFKNIITNSFESSKTAFLKYEIGNIPQPPNGVYSAITKPYFNNGGNSYYKIILDQNFVDNASTIEIAFALLHELIHAELIERCIKLNVIHSIDSNGGVSFTVNPTLILDSQSQIFRDLILHYTNYNGSNSNWNHDIFNALNYRTKIENTLLGIHNLLNDPNNDFLNNVNNDPNLVGGPYTLQELMYYVSWIGLEDTIEYNLIIFNNLAELYRKSYSESVANTKYSHNCLN